MALTIFQTATGEVVYRAQVPRMHAAGKALKAAIKGGFDTLFAIEPDGRKYNYTSILANRKR